MRPDNTPATTKRKPRGNSVEIDTELALDGENVPDLIFRAIRAGRSPMYCLSAATREEALRIAAEGRKSIDLIGLAMTFAKVNSYNTLLRIVYDDNQKAGERMRAIRLLAELEDWFPKKIVEKTVSLKLDPDTIAHLDRMAGIVDAHVIPAEAQALLEHGENTDAEEAA